MSVAQCISKNQPAFRIRVVNLHTKRSVFLKFRTASHVNSGFPTWIVFPFLAVTTSPGLVAFPLGIFSQSGAKPGMGGGWCRDKKCSEKLSMNLNSNFSVTIPTNYIDWQFQGCCRDNRRTHCGGSSHISSHCIHGR